MLDFPTVCYPPPALDADFYILIAKLINNNGGSLAKEPYFYSPFFSNFLAILFNLFGDNILIVRLVSIIFGSAISVILYLIGKEIYKDKSAAWLIFFLSLFWGILIFYISQPLKVVYGLLFLSLALLFFIKSLKIRNIREPTLSGIFFSISILVYNNLLLPVAILSLYLLYKSKKY